MVTYSMEQVLKWKALTRKWQGRIYDDIINEKWSLQPHQDEILILTFFDKSDPQIAESLGIDDPEIINIERSKAMVEILSIYSDIAESYSELPEVKESVETKKKIFQNYLEAIAKWKRDEEEIGELSTEAVNLARAGNMARMIGNYIDVKSQAYAYGVKSFVSIQELAELTGYSESQLGRLLRTSAITGEKVNGEWRATVKAVSDYQDQREARGAPRKARVQSYKLTTEL